MAAGSLPDITGVCILSDSIAIVMASARAFPEMAAGNCRIALPLTGSGTQGQNFRNASF